MCLLRCWWREAEGKEETRGREWEPWEVINTASYRLPTCYVRTLLFWREKPNCTLEFEFSVVLENVLQIIAEHIWCDESLMGNELKILKLLHQSILLKEKTRSNDLKRWVDFYICKCVWKCKCHIDSPSRSIHA